MPASLQDDAIAYLQNQPMQQEQSPQQIAAIMQLLEQRPNLRPSYAQGGDDMAMMDAPVSQPAPAPETGAASRPSSPSGGSSDGPAFPASSMNAPLPPQRPTQNNDAPNAAMQVGAMLGDASPTQDAQPTMMSRLDALYDRAGSLVDGPDPKPVGESAAQGGTTTGTAMDTISNAGNRVAAGAGRVGNAVAGMGNSARNVVNDVVSRFGRNFNEGGDMLSEALGELAAPSAERQQMEDAEAAAAAGANDARSTLNQPPTPDTLDAVNLGIETRSMTQGNIAQNAIDRATMQPMGDIPNAGVADVTSPNAASPVMYGDPGRPQPAAPPMPKQSATLPQARQPNMPQSEEVMRLSGGVSASRNADGTYSLVMPNGETETVSPRVFEQYLELLGQQ